MRRMKSWQNVIRRTVNKAYTAGKASSAAIEGRAAINEALCIYFILRTQFLEDFFAPEL